MLKKESKDLKVYTCTSAGEKIKTLKTELIVENTSLEQLLGFVEDIEKYVNWQYNTIEAKVLLKPSDHSIVYRTVVSAPWPASNREMFTKITSAFDSTSNQLFITNQSVTYNYPKNDELVRVPFSDGTWRVSAINGSSLKIEFTLRIDPGGSLPSWLVNMAMAEGPYFSFKNLKEIMEAKTSE